MTDSPKKILNLFRNLKIKKKLAKYYNDYKLSNHIKGISYQKQKQKQKLMQGFKSMPSSVYSHFVLILILTLSWTYSPNCVAWRKGHHGRLSGVADQVTDSESGQGCPGAPSVVSPPTCAPPPALLRLFLLNSSDLDIRWYYSFYFNNQI